MHYYKIVVAYDGTKYFGWQFQPNKMSVAQVLQDCFKRVFKYQISLFGSSRTDAGVHAIGQVAVFSCDIEIDPKKMFYAWGNSLPQDIFLRSLEEVDKDFHPQFNIEYKIYYYHIFLRQPLPFFAPFGWFVQNMINIENLRQALSVFVGTHDFRSFCTGDYCKSTVRTIYSIDLQYIKYYSCYRIIIKGSGFLHHMIRRIVGSCIDIACDVSLSSNDLIIALNQKNPNQKFFTAPACGLLLRKIVYKKI